jgi:hypothetical protein
MPASDSLLFLCSVFVEEVPIVEAVINMNLLSRVDAPACTEEGFLISLQTDFGVVAGAVVGGEAFALSIDIVEGGVVLLQLPPHDVVGTGGRPATYYAVLVVDLHHFVLFVED